MGTMSLDTYTQNIPLTQKARFWSNYVAALKGSQDLRAPDEAALRTWHPSIIETLPNEFPDLKHEFGKLESQMFDRPRRRGADPLSPVLPDARDRIFSLGYNYCPVHTEIYGTYRARAARAFRRLPITRPGISQKCPEFVFSANVSTKVSNFPRTSFLISLLMLSMGS